VSSKFSPLAIPPGVVSMPTKKMGSSNWAEVNLVRWTEGQLAPVGPQSQYNYSFASRCKKVHGWFDLNYVFHIAYLCEQHLYVDTGGALTNITPTGGLPAPPLPTQGGYGDGDYSDDTYGTPRTIPADAALDRLPTAWSLDNFGAILLAMTSPDGRLLSWNPAVGGLAAPVTASHGVVPKGRSFIVTPERFVMVMCANDPTNGGSFRRFAWCEQEDFTDWDYADVTKQSGFLDIEPSSPIVCALSTRTGNLIWTAKKTYRSRYLGVPYIYNCEELADATTPWSPQSMLATSSLAVWMAQQGPQSFDGTSILPIACKVRQWVDDDIDILNVREQACAVHVSNFNEVWWFFPQLGQPYNTRCIIYNYKDGWWGQGQMSRSAGITASYTSHTIMADGLVAFEHESRGSAVYGNADLPWAETFDLNLNQGSFLTTVKQMIPDVDGALDNVRYSLFYRNSRSAGAPELRTAPQPVRPDGYVDFRTTGRDIRLRIDLATATSGVAPVTVGQHLIDAVPRGDR